MRKVKMFFSCLTLFGLLGQANAEYVSLQATGAYTTQELDVRDGATELWGVILATAGTLNNFVTFVDSGTGGNSTVPLFRVFWSSSSSDGGAGAGNGGNGDKVVELRNPIRFRFGVRARASGCSTFIDQTQGVCYTVLYRPSTP